MRRTPFALVAVLLVIAACGGSDGSSDPSSTTTSTSATTTTSTTTSEPPTTTSTTSAPTSTTTPPPPPGSLFIVSGVTSGDVLNVRSEPDASATILGTLPPGAPVQTTGLATPDLPTAGWWQVTLADGTTGWVNRRFVGLNPAFAAPLAESDCTPVDATTTTSPEAVGDADHILAIGFERGAECDRVVVLLGNHPTGGGDWPESAAGSLPGGISVSAEGSVAVVAFPSEADGGFVDAVRPTATETALDDAEAFVVRSNPASGASAPGGGPEVRVHFHRNVTVSTRFLSDPARIVVDVYPAPTGTGLDYTPHIGGGTVLEHPVDVDLAGPGVTLPVTVAGYGRPFESQGVAQIRIASDTPGSGDLVAATFSGPSGTLTGPTYPYFTTDYTMMWGRFSFTIDGLPPGDYELFVGEFSAKDGTPQGVYDVFTVAD